MHPSPSRQGAYARPARAHIPLARPLRAADARVREAGLAWARGLDLRGVRLRLDRIALHTWAEDRGERLFRLLRS